jgi:hypothetical protein
MFGGKKSLKWRMMPLTGDGEGNPFHGLARKVPFFFHMFVWFSPEILFSLKSRITEVSFVSLGKVLTQ